MDPQLLAQVLRDLPAPIDPRLLAGFQSRDDAGVYRLDAERALVFTTDFFPPVLDDPGDFGRVAAANALSDVYAMGGRPLLALNIACFPSKALPIRVLADILEGGRATCEAAGCLLVGGHTVDDEVLKYGLAVIGEVHPERVWTVEGMQEGDVLVLTKPLGSGILTTALRAGLATESQVEAVTEVMAELNGKAAATAQGCGLRAVTDVTGFGLLGHLQHLVAASEVGVRIDLGRLPLIDGARDLAARGIVTGGAARNRRYVEPRLLVEAGAPAELEELSLDPQTSGGLLAACPAENLRGLLDSLRDAGCQASVIGLAGDAPPGTIRLTPG